MEKFSSTGYMKAWPQATEGCSPVEQEHTHEDEREKSAERTEGMSRAAAEQKLNWAREICHKWEQLLLGWAGIVPGTFRKL